MTMDTDSAAHDQVPTEPHAHTQPASAAGSEERPLFRAGKKSHQCRTCGLQLSSSSNRLRHERTKHKSSLSTPRHLRVGKDQSPMATFKVVELHSESAADPDVVILSAGAHDMEIDQPNSEAESDSELTYDESAGAAQAAAAAQIEGFRPMLQEAELQAGCFPFLQWLSLPPLTSCEALVKARRVKSLTQLQPIKSNLRFIFAVLYEKELIQSIDLKEFSKLPIC